MSSESFGGGVGDDQEAWLRNSLYGIYAEIPLEEDCETLSSQLCRDIYLASEGAHIDLATATEIEIYQYENSLRLAPICDSPQGVVCEWLNPDKPLEEPEIIFVCGTLFDLSTETDDVQMEFPLSEVWPKTSEPILSEALPNGRAAILLNRRVATFGHLALRISYSPKEFAEWKERNPTYFQKDNFERFEKEVKGVHCIRAVPKDVSFLRNTTGISVTDLKGEKTIFGVAA